MLNTDHILDPNTLSETEWKKIVVNAEHDNEEHYHFIDVGCSNS